MEKKKNNDGKKSTRIGEEGGAWEETLATLTALATLTGAEAGRG